MARAAWSGFLSFGLVSIPVGLHSATSDQTIHFNQLHKGTSNRVRYKKIDEETEEELDADEIVSGFPLGDGEYVVVTPEELANTEPGRSQMMEILDFVDLADIDPIFFRQTYYLAPRGKGADQAYALLLQAMRETAKVGIATLVLRDKEHLVAVRPGEHVLMLETMYFEDEIRDPKEELEQLPTAQRISSRELAIAKKLVESLTAEWHPGSYKNTYRQRVEELVEEKRAGDAVVIDHHESRASSNVVDLMSALKSSIEQTGGRHKSTSAVRRPAKKGASRPASAARANKEFAALDKTELLKLAAKRKVAANSKMTKSELVKILRNSSRPDKKSKRSAS